MKEVNVHEAKTNLSRLLHRVASGEEVTIMRAGKPVARLVPVTKPRKRRQLGWAAGEFVVREDFDAPFPEDSEPGFNQ